MAMHQLDRVTGILEITWHAQLPHWRYWHHPCPLIVCMYPSCKWDPKPNPCSFKKPWWQGLSVISDQRGIGLGPLTSSSLPVSDCTELDCPFKLSKVLLAVWAVGNGHPLVKSSVHMSGALPLHIIIVLLSKWDAVPLTVNASLWQNVYIGPHLPPFFAGECRRGKHCL